MRSKPVWQWSVYDLLNTLSEAEWEQNPSKALCEVLAAAQISGDFFGDLRAFLKTCSNSPSGETSNWTKFFPRALLLKEGQLAPIALALVLRELADSKGINSTIGMVDDLFALSIALDSNQPIQTVLLSDTVFIEEQELALISDHTFIAVDDEELLLKWFLKVLPSLLEDKEYNRAIDYSCLALDIFPEELEFYLLRAQGLTKLQRIDEACMELERFLEIAPRDEKARAVNEHCIELKKLVTKLH